MRQQLRPYQQGGIEQLRAGYAQGHKRGLLVLPTGGGKTSIAAEIIESTVARGNKVIFIAHRKELIDQASTRLDEFGVAHGVIMADHPRWEPWLPVQVASIQTLSSAARRNCSDIGTPSLIIIDEAHRAQASTYLAALERWPEARVLGLTATPWRVDGRGLADLFEFEVVAAKPAELIEQGHLVPFEGFTCETVDLSGIRVSGRGLNKGDYDEAELAARQNTSRINGAIVEQWLAKAAGQRTVVFAVNIEHSQSIVEQFRAKGIAAEHLDGTMSKTEREAILGRPADKKHAATPGRLQAGETTVVVNVGVLTEGWDCPIVSCCILARPTKSTALYLQMVGRVLRPAPGKRVARIHDHAGAMLMHGLPDEDRDYSLTATRRKAGPGIASCPQCHRISPAGASICPECGYAFGEGRAGEGGAYGERQLEIVDTPIIDLDEARRRRAASLDAIRQRVPVRMKAAEYKRLLDLAARRGHRPGWAAIQFKRTFGHSPEEIPSAVMSEASPARHPVIPLELLREPEAAHA